MRESFSLPGLTLSVMHHRAGDFMVGATGESGALVELGPRVTSVRAIVGKDLLTAGLSAGVGWDRYGGSDRIRARVPAGTGFEEGRGGPVDAIVRKRYLFLGANFTWLVTQAAGELAWVWGTSPEPGIEGSGGYRPGGTELQGALTFRITY
jgi:hypothetical protein